MTSAVAARPAAPTTPPEPKVDLRLIPLADLNESPLNPRTHYDVVFLAELEASLRATGQLTPAVVRPRPKGGFEIGAGHCRFRAAAKAQLPGLLCIVREMDDKAFIELLTIENLQRKNLDALDEARGFRTLMEKAGYNIQRIADRIGLSTNYVYDRLKLLTLIKPLQDLLLENAITAGHAILLARLTPSDQQRALGQPRNEHRDGGLLQREIGLFESPAQLKPVSVRELKAWIDDKVRLDVEAKDLPDLFPETHQALHRATQAAEKIAPITYEHQIHPAARDDSERTIGPRSWERADGKFESKTCAYAITGVVVVGPGRGDAFKVCLNKDKCAVHWPDQVRAKAKRAKAAKAGGSEGPKGADRAAKEHAREQQASAERKRKEAAAVEARKRWVRARPALLEALAEKVKKAPAGGRSELAEQVVDAVAGSRGWSPTPIAKLAAYVPRGSSAEDLIRHAAFIVLAGDFDQEYHLESAATKVLKAFGLDAKKIVDAAAPAKAAAGKTPATKKAKKT